MVFAPSLEIGNSLSGIRPMKEIARMVFAIYENAFIKIPNLLKGCGIPESAYTAIPGINVSATKYNAVKAINIKMEYVL